MDSLQKLKENFSKKGLQGTLAGVALTAAAFLPFSAHAAEPKIITAEQSEFSLEQAKGAYQHYQDQGRNVVIIHKSNELDRFADELTDLIAKKAGAAFPDMEITVLQGDGHTSIFVLADNNISGIDPNNIYELKSELDRIGARRSETVSLSTSNDEPVIAANTLEIDR